MSLANMRKFNRMSQTDLAEAIGVHPSAIQKIEQGYRCPYRTLYDIAKLLNCEVSALIKSDDEPFGEDEIIAVPSVAAKHVGRPCFFGNTVEEVMANAEGRKNLILVEPKEGAMLDNEGKSWRYILPNRKFQPDNLPRGRKGKAKREGAE